MCCPFHVSNIKNIDYSICTQIEDTNNPFYILFHIEMKEHLKIHYDSINTTVEKLKEKYPIKKIIKTGLYDMTTLINYSKAGIHFNLDRGFYLTY